MITRPLFSSHAIRTLVPSVGEEVRDSFLAARSNQVSDRCSATSATAELHWLKKESSELALKLKQSGSIRSKPKLSES